MAFPLGDKNNKFFQTQALIKRKKNQSLRIKDDSGQWHGSPDQITSIFLASFKTRFSAPVIPARNTMLDFTSLLLV